MAIRWGSYLSDQRALRYDVSRSSWIGDYLDPNTFLDVFLGGRGGQNHHGDSAEILVGLDFGEHFATVLFRQAEVQRGSLAVVGIIAMVHGGIR